MTRLDEIKNVRLQKIENLEKAGMSAYSLSSKRDYTLKEVIDNFNSLKNQKQS